MDWKDASRFFASLSAGAILIMATFLQKDPGIPGAKYLVKEAFALFFQAFIFFLVSYLAGQHDPAEQYRWKWVHGFVSASHRVFFSLGYFCFSFALIIMLLFGLQIVEGWG